MNSPIVFVSGSKGGVGKSITAMAVLDYLTVGQKLVKLVESDTSNPDVWKSYNRSVECEQVNLDDVEGWIQLVNTCDAQSFKNVVVNTPARNNAGVKKHGDILTNSLHELGRPLVTLWVINRQRDSLDLLSEYLDLMPGGVVHVVQNGYFGEEKKYELYRASALHGPFSPGPVGPRHRRALYQAHHAGPSGGADEDRRPGGATALAGRGGANARLDRALMRGLPFAMACAGGA
jgi:hypothetical protein